LLEVEEIDLLGYEGRNVSILCFEGMS